MYTSAFSGSFFFYFADTYPSYIRGGRLSCRFLQQLVVFLERQLHESDLSRFSKLQPGMGGKVLRRYFGYRHGVKGLVGLIPPLRYARW